MEKYEGACFCGAVRIEAEGAPAEMGYCHCASCRAYSGAPVNGFVLFPADRVRVTKGEALLRGVNKTGFSDRCSCSACGGSVFVRHPTLGLIDIPAGILPTLAFKPAVHLNYAETVLPMRDGLPKLRDFPKEAGGSGEAMAE